MSSILQQLSDALAEAVSTAAPGVVRIEGRRRLPASGIVWSGDGLILTANHVVQRDDKLKVGLEDGQSLSASLVGRDPTTDLALLRVEGDVIPITKAHADGGAVGNLVLALGRPGKSAQATFGVISALGGGWRTRHGGQIDRYLQTDVVMYPGFSGGPLVDASGQLLGLNSSALAQGVSLTIPATTLTGVAEMLQTHGRVRRGYLGVSTQQVRLPEALREQLGQKSGLLLVSVEAGSPADQSGLVLGDTIVALNETAIRNHDDLLAMLTGERVGQATPLKIVRGGKVQTVDVTIGERK